MPLEIRALTQADLPAVRALWKTTAGVELSEGDSLDELARYLERNPGLSSVALESGRIIGAVLCGHDGRRGYVYHLAVAREHRDRRIGRQIMQRSLTALKQAGIPRALLLVATDNPRGRRFWRREGWEDMGFAQPMGIDL